MQCMLGLAREFTARLPLFSLLCSSEDCQSLRVASLDIGRHHRLNWMVTGSGLWSSTHNESIGFQFIAGRHSMKSIGIGCLLNLFDSSRGQDFAWQCNSSNVCTYQAPFHVYDSKGHGPWFSDHQSRISMRDGPRDQVCTFWCQMQCKPTNQSPNPITRSRNKTCVLDAMQPRHVS